MKFLFLMDPLENLHYKKDTTFAFMMASFRRGHEIYYLSESGISFREGKVYFRATPIRIEANPEKPFVAGKEKVLSQNEVAAVFVRPDPPFDEVYLNNMWLLDHLPKNIFVINSAHGIRTVNEKLWAGQFTELTPKTLFTYSLSEALAFVEEIKDVILKPTNGFGGASIFRLKKGDVNVRVTLETLNCRGKELMVLQEYIPAAEKGDKRILLLDGEFLGAVLRVHAIGEHRNNFFAGGTAHATTLTEREKKIIATLKPQLQKLELYFVGIDVIGDYLIEVNVTSPTCLQEINSLQGVKLEDKVIDFVEAKIKQIQ